MVVHGFLTSYDIICARCWIEINSAMRLIFALSSPEDLTAHWGQMPWVFIYCIALGCACASASASLWIDPCSQQALVMQWPAVHNLVLWSAWLYGTQSWPGLNMQCNALSAVNCINITIHLAHSFVQSDLQPIITAYITCRYMHLTWWRGCIWCFFTFLSSECT